MEQRQEYLITLIGRDLATQQITTALNKIAGVTRATARQVEKDTSGMGGGFSAFGKQILATVGKVALAVPVFYALRAAYQTFFASIREGIKYLVEFDAGIAKALTVTKGVKDLEAFRVEFEKLARSMMLTTGATATEVTQAFYEFGTAGLDAATSIAGMETSLKTSIAMMGDSRETARALSDIYKMLGDSIDGASTPAEKFEAIGGTLAVLWKDNTFTLKEFVNGVKRFGGVAASLNITFDQTAALLATVNDLMQRGETGGTQLAVAFSRVLKNSDKIGELLGEKVNLGETNAFDLFVKTIEKLNEIPSAALRGKKAFEIFGERASRAAISVANRIDILKKNMELLGNFNNSERFQNLLIEYDRRMDTIARQSLVLRATVNVAFESFATAATNSADLEEGIGKISEAIRAAIPELIEFGANLNYAFKFLRLFSSAYSILKINMKASEKEIIRQTNAIAKLTQEQKDQLALASGAEREDLLVKFGVVSDATDFIANLDRTLALAEEQIKAKNLIKGILNPGEVEKNVKETIEAITSAFDAQKAGLEYDDLQKKFKETAEEMSQAAEKRGETIGKNLAGGVKTGLKNYLLGGEEDLFSVIAAQIKDQLADSVAEGIVNGIKNTTIGGFNFFDFFGNAFEQIENQMSSPAQDITAAFVAGGDLVYDKIVDAFAAADHASAGDTADAVAKIPQFLQPAKSRSQIIAEADIMAKSLIKAQTTSGIAQGAQSAALTGIQAAATGAARQGIFGKIGGGVTGAFSAVGSALGGAAGISRLLASGVAIGGVTGGMRTGGLAGGVAGLGTALALQKAIQAGTGSLALSQLGLTKPTNIPIGAMSANYLSGGLAMAAGGYQAYQGFKSGNTLGGIGGGLTAAGGLAMMIPGGQVVGLALMAAGMITSLFGSSKKKSTQVTTKEDTFTVGSKIDITNKRLEMVNRDLTAIRNTIETYILPESAYFSEASVADTFAVDKKRLAR